MILFEQVSIDQLHNLSFNIKRDDFVLIFNKDNNILKRIRKLITGCQKPEKGLVKTFNKNRQGNNFKNALGIVYNENILLSSRTIKDNLIYILYAKKLQNDFYKRRINKVIEIVNLKECTNKIPDQLLPHQLVRANIAQALLAYPSLLILENPTSQIDEVNSRGLLNLMKNINEKGITIVLLTSDNRVLSLKEKNIKKINLAKKGEILSEQN